MRRAWPAAAALALSVLAGCAEPAPPTPADTATFAEGTTMATLAQSGKIRIGVKTDVPGLGYIDPDSADDTPPEGFDIEIAKIVAGELGLGPDSIEFVSVSTFNREYALVSDRVDLVVASYSMTPERAEKVGQAGPYYVTGQQLMVREDESDILEADDMAGKTVCAVAGSTSNEAIIAEGAITKAYSSYRLCVEALLAGDLDAVSTDGAILAGFIDQHPDELRITGLPFTTERYGIGYRLGDAAMCQFLRQTLLEAYADGTWKTAYEATLGKDGLEAPRAPMPDDCPVG